MDWHGENMDRQWRAIPLPREGLPRTWQRLSSLFPTSMVSRVRVCVYMYVCVKKRKKRKKRFSRSFSYERMNRVGIISWQKKWSSSKFFTHDLPMSKCPDTFCWPEGGRCDGVILTRQLLSGFNIGPCRTNSLHSKLTIFRVKHHFFGGSCEAMDGLSKYRWFSLLSSAKNWKHRPLEADLRCEAQWAQALMGVLGLMPKKGRIKLQVTTR